MKTETLAVCCENDGRLLEVAAGTPLSEIAPTVANPGGHPWLAALVNNRSRGLTRRIYRPCTLRFIDITSFEGYRIYQRTALFILQKALHDLWPEARLIVRNSMGQSGFYCEVEGPGTFGAGQVDLLVRRMRAVVEADYPIACRRLPTGEVRRIYTEQGWSDKLDLLDTRPRLYSKLYTLDGVAGYFYGTLALSTGCVQVFDLVPYDAGFYIALPLRKQPGELRPYPGQEKMFDIFRDYKRWNEILGVSTVGRINRRILEGRSGEMIRIAEAFHEKTLAAIADRIREAALARGARLVLLSGPSSSGKTTSAKRLCIQLQVLGFDPVAISLDDYFVEREQTPRDENGEYDYEALEAIDLPLFNDHLMRLFNGEAVRIPRYNFLTGGREWHETPLQLGERSLLVVEGIHGLNPRLTPQVPDDWKFKIYVSCFTSVSLDAMNRIATTDNRLLRRMVRDYATRGSNALATLSRWESVRRGEERHIFPYQEEADVMFNSSLFYELSVLRPLAEAILHEVPDTVPEYDEARRLLRFLDNFTPIRDTKDIPAVSVLREFVGGSTFSY